MIAAADDSVDSSWNDTTDDETVTAIVRPRPLQRRPEQVVHHLGPIIPPSVVEWKPYCSDSLKLHHHDVALRKARRLQDESEDRSFAQRQVVSELLHLLNGQTQSDLVEIDELGNLTPKRNVFLDDSKTLLFRVIEQTLQSGAQVRQITDFIASDPVPKTIRALQDVLQDFICDHTRILAKMHQIEKIGVVRLNYLLKPQLDRFATVHSLILPLVDSAEKHLRLDYFAVQDLLESLLTCLDLVATQDIHLLKTLWDMFVAVLQPTVRFLDRLLLDGEIDDSNGEFFIVREEVKVSFRAKPVRCRLFSGVVLEKLVQGADAATFAHHLPIATARQGRLRFSQVFAAQLNDAQDSGRSPSEQLLDAIHISVDRCFVENNKLLMDCVHSGNELSTILGEIGVIYSAFALRDFAREFSAAIGDNDDLDVEKTFERSLEMNGIMKRRVAVWSVLVNGGINSVTVYPKCQWPLNAVISEGLLEVLNSVLRLLLELLVARNKLVRLRFDRRTQHSDRQAARKAHFFLSDLLQSLNAVLGIYSTHVFHLIKHHASIICAAKSFREVQERAADLATGLRRSVPITNSSHLIRAAVLKLCELSVEFTGLWMNDEIRTHPLNGLSAVLVRNRQLLAKVANISADSGHRI